MSKKTKPKSDKELFEEIAAVIGQPAPAEIKNPEAYLEYLRNDKHAIHDKIITIGEEQVPLKSPHPVLVKKLKAAGFREADEEFIKVLNQKKLQMQIKMKANSAIRKAYGTIVNNQGEKVELKSVFDPYKQELIELFGRMFSSKEVHEFCLVKLKLVVKLNSVQDFRHQNITEINKLIEEHKRTYSDIRLGHKRSRLEELVWMYHDRKRIYEITKKADDYRLLLQTIAQIKDEAEGDVIRIDGNVSLNINQTVDDHISQTLKRTVPIKEIVLGRIAAKTNTDVKVLVASINSGYYRKAIDAETEDAEFEVMPSYPSSSNYDFERIRGIQAQKEQQRAAEATKPIDQALVQTGNKLRELLLKKVAEKQGDVNYAKNTVVGAIMDKANEK